jgi:hypothetical protein
MITSLIIGLVLVYGIGLLPSVLIRFVFMKRAVSSKTRTIGIVFLIYIYNIMVHTAAAGHATTPGIHIGLVVVLSYYILRKGSYIITLTDEVKPICPL